jgi:hypothetical protein
MLQLGGTRHLIFSTCHQFREREIEASTHKGRGSKKRQKTDPRNMPSIPSTF